MISSGTQSNKKTVHIKKKMFMNKKFRLSKRLMMDEGFASNESKNYENNCFVETRLISSQEQRCEPFSSLRIGCEKDFYRCNFPNDHLSFDDFDALSEKESSDALEKLKLPILSKEKLNESRLRAELREIIPLENPFTPKNAKQVTNCLPNIVLKKKDNFDEELITGRSLLHRKEVNIHSHSPDDLCNDIVRCEKWKNFSPDQPELPKPMCSNLDYLMIPQL